WRPRPMRWSRNFEVHTIIRRCREQRAPVARIYDPLLRRTGRNGLAAAAASLLLCAMRSGAESALECRADGNHGRSPGVHGRDDLGVVDPLQVPRGDPAVAVAESPLDDYERHAFVGQFDG